MKPVSPASRALIGIAIILLLIVLWAVLVSSLSPVVGRWPVLLQAIFYLVFGIAWIIPLKPLVTWVTTGSWRRPSH